MEIERFYEGMLFGWKKWISIALKIYRIEEKLFNLTSGSTRLEKLHEADAVEIYVDADSGPI